MPPSRLRSINFIKCAQLEGGHPFRASSVAPTRSVLGDHHVERRQHDVDVRAELVDAMKAALGTRAAPGDVIAVVGKMLAGSEAGSLADDLVALKHQTAAVRLKDHPFAPEQGCLLYTSDAADEE